MIGSSAQAYTVQTPSATRCSSRARKSCGRRPPEDGGPLDAPYHHMVERVGRIQARVPWHDDRLPFHGYSSSCFRTNVPYPGFGRRVRLSQGGTIQCLSENLMGLG